jgi:hypothetical protein
MSIFPSSSQPRKKWIVNLPDEIVITGSSKIAEMFWLSKLGIGSALSGRPYELGAGVD